MEGCTCIGGNSSKVDNVKPGTKGQSYEQSVRRTFQNSSEFRNMHGDLAEVYEIMSGLGKMVAEKMFPLSFRMRCW